MRAYVKARSARQDDATGRGMLPEDACTSGADPNEVGEGRKGPDHERGASVFRFLLLRVCVFRIGRDEPEKHIAAEDVDHLVDAVTFPKGSR